MAWGGATTCASCHGASNDGNLSAGATAGHVKHYQTATAPTTMTDGNAHTTTAYVFACSNCHPTATHAQGPADATGPIFQDAQIGGTKQTGANYTQAGTSTTDAKGLQLHERHLFDRLPYQGRRDAGLGHHGIARLERHECSGLRLLPQ